MKPTTEKKALIIGGLLTSALVYLNFSNRTSLDIGKKELNTIPYTVKVGYKTITGEFNPLIDDEFSLAIKDKFFNVEFSNNQFVTFTITDTKGLILNSEIVELVKTGTGIIPDGYSFPLEKIRTENLM